MILKSRVVLVRNHLCSHCLRQGGNLVEHNPPLFLAPNAQIGGGRCARKKCTKIDKKKIFKKYLKKLNIKNYLN
jgi:hypothetical protein